MTKNESLFSGEEKVADVIGRFPGLQETFVVFGFKNIVNPIMRATIARKVTLRMACEMRGVNLDEFLHALNEEAGKAKL